MLAGQMQTLQQPDSSRAHSARSLGKCSIYHELQIASRMTCKARQQRRGAQLCILARAASQTQANTRCCHLFCIRSIRSIQHGARALQVWHCLCSVDSVHQKLYMARVQLTWLADGVMRGTMQLLPPSVAWTEAWTGDLNCHRHAAQPLLSQRAHCQLKLLLCMLSLWHPHVGCVTA